jgi:hypothetical protein
MDAVSEFRQKVLAAITVAAVNALDSLSGDQWRLIYAWWSNEAKDLISSLDSDLELIVANNLPIDMDELLDLPELFNGLDDIRTQVEEVGSSAHDVIVAFAQKAGILPVTEQITTVEFNRYQRVMSTYPIMMDDENDYIEIEQIIPASKKLKTEAQHIIQKININEIKKALIPLKFNKK